MPQTVYPTSEASGAQGVQVATVSLTAAQIKALNATGITIVPAPLDTQVLIPCGPLAVYLDAGTNAFAANGGNLVLNYGTNTGNPWSVVADTILTQTADGFAMALLALQNDVLSKYAGLALILTASADLALGPIRTSSKNAGGSGYVANDTGTVDGGDDDAAYTVLTVSAGAVVTYSLTAGTGYATGTAVTTTPGGGQAGVGTGFKVNILTVGGNGTMRVSLPYVVLNLS